MARTKPEVVVARRNLRWEVAVRGLTRPMIDWLCTKERAIQHAVERAHEMAAADGHSVLVAVMTPSGEVEQERVVDGRRVA